MMFDELWVPRLGPALGMKVARLVRRMVISRLILPAIMAVSAIFVIFEFGGGRRPNGTWAQIVAAVLVLAVLVAAVCAIGTFASVYRFGRQIARVVDVSGRGFIMAPIFNLGSFDRWAAHQQLTRPDFEHAFAAHPDMKNIPRARNQ